MSLYSIKQENINVEQSLRSYMDAGIYSNVKMTAVSCETSKNDNVYLSFYFENSKGEKVSKTEWEVTANKPLDTMSSEEKAAYLKKINN